MAMLDKDTHQKEKAIRYCISNGMLPYLEVIVGNVREISDTKTVITDLDVIGIEVSRRGILRKTLFDCKTVAKMSAINRAFWASGIMSYTNCDEAYVILTKKATEAHRVSAKTLNVHLFQEYDFDNYAQSANINYLDTLSYLSKIKNWHAYYDIFEKNQSLKPLGEYLNTKVPLEKDNAKLLRELLGIVRSVRGEFDPEKKEHLSIYSSIILSFLFIMSPISSQIGDIYDQSMSQQEYEKILRYYIWGGRESYIQRRDLKNAVLEASGSPKGELELPGWRDFVEISRSLLDAPSEISQALIPCREISVRFVSDIDVSIDVQLKARLNKSNRTQQFILATSAYLCKSTGIPKDFHAQMKETLNEVENASNQ